VKDARANPCALVIFGASGDLTKRKLLPALYNLAVQNLLPEEFAVVGIARRPMSREEFRRKIEQDIAGFIKDADREVLRRLGARLHYVAGDGRDGETYRTLDETLAQADREHKTPRNRVFYLATAPDLFAPIVEQLGRAGLAREENGEWRRVVIEKPFGRDLNSAKELNRKLRAVLEESQIYRIDHFLGKETVQNLMVFRFANGIFEPTWNRRYIDHVQITVGESLGVEQRGASFDRVGTLRDMVPNHIFQLLSLTAMEPPVSFEADAVRDKQVDVLRAIQPLKPEDVLQRAVRGQYGAGTAPGYRQEASVPPDSKTETFVALKLAVDNWRWADVPLFVRTGKRMPCRTTEIMVQFKRAPFMLFRKTGVDRLPPNQLVIRIQPQEGISLSFGAKKPGAALDIGTVDMDFRYQDYFGERPSTGYERLLYDCMLGDATLFQRADMVETGWGVIEPILDVWSSMPARDFPNYAAGTWGPEQADALLQGEGRRWRRCAG
jgi:glucose-6-phosphate 1-dehydrogenase